MGKEHAPPRDGFGVNKKPHRRGSAREDDTPASLQDILSSFAKCFTRPSFENFITLMVGWLLCSGRHTISRVMICYWLARPIPLSVQKVTYERSSLSAFGRLSRFDRQTAAAAEHLA